MRGQKSFTREELFKTEKWQQISAQILSLSESHA
jgi:hypothetical protein